jgi:hypothetical protein
MQNWHLLYNTATGESVSIGTVIADPLPEGITALPLTDAEGEGLQNGMLVWDDATRTLIHTPPPAVTAEEHLRSVGLAGDRQPTLLYLRQSLTAAGKTCAELDAVEAYLQQVLTMFAANPAPQASWPNPSVTFEAAVQAAMQTLLVTPEPSEGGSPVS